MKWRVVIRPEVETDITEAVKWYEERESGLGAKFLNEVFNARRHPHKNIRWRYPEHFPYRIVYEVIEADHTVVVAAVIHAARHDRHWQKRI